MPALASPLANTLILTLATLAIAIPIGVALAWLLVRSDVPLAGIGRLLTGMMLFIPLYLQTGAWQAGFGPEGWYTLLSGGAPLLDGLPAAIWIHSMAAIPWVAFFAGVGLRIVEPELEEQAMLDGSPWHVFRHATLPGIWPSIVLAALWVAVQTAGEMTVTDFYAVRTAAETAYTDIVAGDTPAASLLAMLPATIAVGAGLAIALRMFLFRPNVRPLSLRRTLIVETGQWRWPLAALLAMALAVLVGVPVFNLLCKAGWKVTAVDSVHLRFWSPTKCLAMVLESPRRCPRELFWTLVICALAATAAVIFGGAIAWVARLKPAAHWPVSALTGIGLALPGPMLALCITLALDRPEIPGLAALYDRSIFAPWLVLTLRAAPAALVLLWHAWATLPDDVLASAALDGAGPIRQLLYVAVPQRWPAIAIAWLFAFAIAMGDLAATILVVPPGIRTLAIHVFNLLHYGVEDQVAGLCLAMMAMCAAIGLAVRLAAGWRYPRVE